MDVDELASGMAGRDGNADLSFDRRRRVPGRNCSPEKLGPKQIRAYQVNLTVKMERISSSVFVAVAEYGHLMRGI